MELITLGQISAEESNTIMLLFSRKKALEELLPTLDMKKNEELYEKIVDDLSTTNTRITDWWKQVATKYSWEYSIRDMWRLDYETATISLVRES